MDTKSTSTEALDGLVVIGPGRLGRSVERLLRERGWPVTLLGRGVSIPAAPLVWLTVPDRAVHQVAATCDPTSVVLHASGALSEGVLGEHSEKGSLHPLMTFPGVELAMPTHPVPAAVSGTPRARELASALAVRLGWRAFEINGDRRLYHASAVMAGNFATTLLGLASRLIQAAGVPESEATQVLLPLALQSLENAAKVGPSNALTGPVARGDTEVIHAHFAAIAEQIPDLLPIYQSLVRATQDMRGVRTN
jgi:predicted short-subunit dehydrogenase-like oxidoreductase (DUF2520 family)